MIPRPQEGERKSKFDAFRKPEERGLVRRPETTPSAPAVPKGFELFAPSPPSALIPKGFEAFAPAPSERARETNEEKEAREMALYKDLFPRAQAEEKDIIEAFKPEPENPREAPPLQTFEGTWTMDTVEEMAARMGMVMDLDRIFNEIRESRQLYGFRQLLEESARHGRPLAIPLFPVTQSEFFSDFSEFFGFPIQVWEVYLHTYLSEEEADIRFWEEILRPLIFRFTDAMDSLKPQDIPGWFTIDQEGAPNEYWVHYVETLSRIGQEAKDQPTKTVETDEEGTVVERWKLKGKYHREDGPAHVETNPDGYRREEWWIGGRKHREDGPAEITTEPDGFRGEEWWINGLRHREGGPAFITTYPDGTHRDEWWINDRRHREDGPAVIQKGPDEGSIHEEWWINGKKVGV